MCNIVTEVTKEEVKNFKAIRHNYIANTVTSMCARGEVIGPKQPVLECDWTVDALEAWGCSYTRASKIYFHPSST